MGALHQDEKLVDRMYHRAKADRWRVSKSSFARALEASAARMFAGRTPESLPAESGPEKLFCGRVGKTQSLPGETKPLGLNAPPTL